MLTPGITHRAWTRLEGRLAHKGNANRGWVHAVIRLRASEYLDLDVRVHR